MTHPPMPGHLRPPGAGCQDRASIHLPQQGQQPLYQPAQGVQGNLLAGGDHPVLPADTAQVRTDATIGLQERRCDSLHSL
jgi:hypothetical protein